VTARALTWTWRIGRWLRTHPYTAVGSIILVILSVPFLTRSDSEWEYVYVQAAQQLRTGHDIYQPEIANSYPPFATWTALPFTWLSPAGQRWLWLVINLGCLVFVLRGAWILAGGSNLEGTSPAATREHFGAIVGGLCGIFYLQNCLAHHQTDIVLAALLIGGCLALRRERVLFAATCFGLAAAVKCTPLLWAPYLIWRRRPAAVVWLGAVALGVNLLPDLVYPSASGHLWLTEYVNRYLLPMSQSDHYVGTWASAIVYNQSLAGAGQRWFITTWEWTSADCVVFRRADPLAPLTLKGIVLGIEAALVLLTLAICRRPFQSVPLDDNRPVRRNALEYSVVFLLMLLFSPMSSKAHFGVLILPGFCLARTAINLQRRWLWPILVAAILLALASNKDPLGERLYTLTLWLGCVTWETLLLLAGCLALLATGDNPVSEAMTAAAPDSPTRIAA
jgi:hypothetical protein